MRDENGEIYTVRYEAVNAMLLNEFLKEHRVVQDQQEHNRRTEVRCGKGGSGGHEAKAGTSSQDCAAAEANRSAHRGCPESERPSRSR